MAKHTITIQVRDEWPGEEDIVHVRLQGRDELLLRGFQSVRANTVAESIQEAANEAIRYLGYDIEENT